MSKPIDSLIIGAKLNNEITTLERTEAEANWGLNYFIFMVYLRKMR